MELEFKGVQWGDVNNMKMMSINISSCLSLAYSNICVGSWVGAKHSFIPESFPIISENFFRISLDSKYCLYLFKFNGCKKSVYKNYSLKMSLIVHIFQDLFRTGLWLPFFSPCFICLNGSICHSHSNSKGLSKSSKIR